MTPNRIIEHIFHVPDLHQVDEAALNSMVAEYPYFAAARILRARKDYSRHSDVNSPAVKTGSLYSHQQHYYYHFITAAPVLMEVEERIPAIIPEDALPAGPSADLLDAVATAPANPLRVVAKATEVVETPDVAATAGAPVQEASVAEIKDAIAEERAAESEAPAAVSDPSGAAAAVTGTTGGAFVSFSGENSAPPENEVPSNPTAALLPAAEGETEAELATLDPSIHPEKAAENNIESSAVADNPAPIKIFPLELATEETELTFQPLYTDDYFAYKRLKDPENADELSIRGEAEMKSFTSWLRQIKDNFAGKGNKDWYQQQLHRIYEEDEEPEISETVEKMALDSIRINNDIVSETLAEIWVRQRQYQNAIQIYQKLSLLNPDKNAYFAQKIKDLKSLIDNNNK